MNQRGAVFVEFPEDLTVTQRAAITGWELGSGRVLTSTELMNRFGISRTSALGMLNQISECLPIGAVELRTVGKLQEWSRIDQT